MFSTSGGGGGGGGDTMSTLGDIMSTSKDIMMHVGDIMSTSGMFSTLGDVMMHVGEQVGKNLSISIENPNVLNIPRCTHDIRTNVLMISPRCTLGIPNMHHDIHPDVLNIPQCTHGISPMY